jgi:hypothetical protein
MSETSYTPGPWDRVLDENPYCRDDDRLNVIGPNGELIATLNRCPPGVERLSSGQEVKMPGCGGDPEANARLIAKAPELLALLEECYDALPHGDLTTRIAAVLTRAKSKEPHP